LGLGFAVGWAPGAGLLKISPFFGNLGLFRIGIVAGALVGLVGDGAVIGIGLAGFVPTLAFTGATFGLGAPSLAIPAAAVLEGGASALGHIANVVKAVKMSPDGGSGSGGKTPWEPGPNDADWRGSGKSVGDALDEAFDRTGVPKEQFEVTRWGQDANGKSFPTEWRSSGGGEVNIDLGHSSNGPQAPHVGWQTPGKRGLGGGVRGHILLDDVPVNR
jgi:hypothetical protein